MAVAFSDVSGGNPASWEWDFGDGNSSTLQNPVHVYSSSGSYTVNLTITNTLGSNSSVKTNYIKVFSPVGADFSGVPRSGITPFPVSFTDTSTGSPTGWAWYFGDENYTQPWTQMTASADWSGRSPLYK